MDEFSQGLEEIRKLDSLIIEGLMTMAPLTDNTAEIRRTFATLRKLRDDAGLKHLSMGMSNDYQIAVEEGATILRIGSKLFS